MHCVMFQMFILQVVVKYPQVSIPQMSITGENIMIYRCIDDIAPALNSDLVKSYSHSSNTLILIERMHFSFLQGYFEGVGIWEYGTTMMVSMVLSILLHSSIETYTWVSAGIMLIKMCILIPRCEAEGGFKECPSSVILSVTLSCLLHIS